MSTPKHTPGPWTLERDRAKSLSIYASSTFVGEVYNEVDEPSAQENANAHLIAAAPAMYALLEQISKLRKDWRVVGGLPSTEYMDELDTLDIDGLLAQAEGKL